MDEVKHALAVVHSPHVDRALRDQAHEVLQGVLESKEDGVPCAVALLSSPPDDACVPHFALDVLSRQVALFWHEMEQEQHQYLRDFAAHLCTTECVSWIEGEYFLVEKAAGFLSQVLMRSWPNEWPSVLDDLLSFAATSDATSQCAGLYLARFMEDVRSDAVPKTHKMHLLKAMREFLPHLVQFGKHLCVTGKERVDANKSPLLAEIACVYLEALSKVLSAKNWVDFDMVSVAVSMLTVLPVRERAASIVANAYTLFKAGDKKGDREALILSAFDSLPLLSHSLGTSPAAADDSLYDYQKIAAQALNSIACSFLSVTADGSSYAELVKHPNFHGFLQMMIDTFGHDSRLICHSVMPFWSGLFTNSTLVKTPAFTDFLESFVGAIASQLNPLSYPSEGDLDECENLSPAVLYIAHDFTSDEFQTFESGFRRSVLHLLELSASCAPEYCIEYGRHHLQKAAGNTASFEALVSFVHHVMMAFGRENFHNNEKLVRSSWECLNALLQLAIDGMNDNDWSGGDKNIATLAVSGVRGFSPLLEVDPSLTERVLEGMFHILRNTRRESVGDPIDVRRNKVCTTLINLCSKLAHHLIPQLEGLSTIVAGLRETITAGERRLLLEALVEVSNAFKTRDERTAFLTSILDKEMGVLLSSDLEALLSSSHQFCQGMGLVPPEEHCSVREELCGTMELLCAVLKRSSVIPDDKKEAESGGYVVEVYGVQRPVHPLSLYIPCFIGRVLKLLGVLNSLWDPGMRAEIEAIVPGLLDIDPATAFALLGDKKGMVEVQHDKSIALRRLLHNRIDRLWISANNIVASASSLMHQFYYGSEDLPQILFGAVISYLPHLPPHRVRTLIRILLKPLFVNCPRERISWFCPPLFLPIARHMLAFLSDGWQKVFDRQASRSEGTSEFDEMLHDKLLRDVSREYVDCLKCILISSHDEDASLPPPPGHSGHTVSAFCSALLESKSAVMPVMGVLLAALAWPDSAAFQSACSSLLVLLRELNTRPPYHELVLGQVATCVLRSVEGAAEQEMIQLSGLFDVVISCPREDLIHAMLRALPHVQRNPSIVQTLNEMLIEAGDRTRFRRIAIRTFLEPLSGEPRKSAVRRGAVSETFELLHNLCMSAEAERAKDAEMWGADVQSLDIGKLWDS